MSRTQRYIELMTKAGIPEDVHDELISLVESGEASAEFCKQLDSNSDWQKVVEDAFVIRFEKLRDQLSVPA